MKMIMVCGKILGHKGLPECAGFDSFMVNVYQDTVDCCKSS
jgi:hypothetical protein